MRLGLLCLGAILPLGPGGELVVLAILADHDCFGWRENVGTGLALLGGRHGVFKIWIGCVECLFLGVLVSIGLEEPAAHVFVLNIEASLLQRP